MNKLLKLVNEIADLNDAMAMKEAEFKIDDKGIVLMSENLNYDIGLIENVEGVFSGMEMLLGSEFSDKISELQTAFCSKANELNNKRIAYREDMNQLQKERNQLVELCKVENDVSGEQPNDIRVVSWGKLTKYEKSHAELVKACSETDSVSLEEQELKSTDRKMTYSFLRGSDEDIVSLIRHKTKSLKHSASSLDEFYPKLKESSTYENLIFLTGDLIDLKSVRLKDIMFK